MPAIITHDLFGKDVYGETFDTIGGSRDAAEAFLLGNQGPDPLFFVAPDPRYRRVGKLASTLHRARPAEFLVALKSAVRELPAQERSVGTRLRAGLRVPLPAGQHVHPLIISQVNALCGAGVEGLTTEDAHEVHAVIETELDELVLYGQARRDRGTYHPATRLLRGRDSMLDTVGRLYATAIDDAFGLTMPMACSKAPCGPSARPSGPSIPYRRQARRALRCRCASCAPHAMTGAMSHRAAERATSAFAKDDERAPWRHPATEAVSRASFWDLYDQARAGAWTPLRPWMPTTSTWPLPTASRRLKLLRRSPWWPSSWTWKTPRPATTSRRAESVGTPIDPRDRLRPPLLVRVRRHRHRRPVRRHVRVRARYDIFGTVAIACFTGMGGWHHPRHPAAELRPVRLPKPLVSPVLRPGRRGGVLLRQAGHYLDPIVDLLDNISVALWAIIGAVDEPLGGPYRHPLGRCSAPSPPSAGASPARAHEHGRPSPSITGPIYGSAALIGCMVYCHAEGQRSSARHGGHPVRPASSWFCAYLSLINGLAPQAAPRLLGHGVWKAWRDRCASSRARCTCP